MCLQRGGAGTEQMERLPWLSAGAVGTVELESASSFSLLHSIYGSQVSQVLLASDDGDLSVDCQNRATFSHNAVRPKSSPAASRLETENRRKTSMQPSSSSALVQKRQLRSRPESAHIHTSITPQVRFGRRPGSSLARYVSSSLFVEEVENDSLQRTAIHDTKPVPLTRVPEYVNFWQGKPLSQRDNAILVHKRKAWQRPKSDYGSRIPVHKNSEKALATVLEGVDGSARSSGSSGLWTEVGHSKSGTTTHGTDLLEECGTPLSRYTINQNNKLRGDEGSVGGDDRQGEGKGGRSGAGGRTRANMWAQRAQRSRVRTQQSSSSSSCDDDDGFSHKDEQMHTQWLDVGGHGTTTRFELPMDILLLERMSPLQYLRAHCIISNHRLSLCSKVFTKLDKDRDGYLSRQEVEVALQKAMYGCLSQSQAQHLLALVHFSLETTADLHLFAALCCVAERVFSIHLWPALAGKEVIECVDFEALEWKLRGCHIGQSLQMLFTLL